MSYFINVYEVTNSYGRYFSTGESPFDTVADAVRNAASECVKGTVYKFTILTDGVRAKVLNLSAWVEAAQCEDKFEEHEEGCVCGQHNVYPAEPDVGIRHAWMGE